MRSALLRLGFYNGLLIGLGLAVGLWVLDVIYLGLEPVLWFYPTLGLGVTALALIGGAGGWLTARFDSPLAGGLIGLVAAVMATWVVVHLPFDVRTVVVWLLDSRFWGLPIYPGSQGIENVLAGFFPTLLFMLLGVFQQYRLEGVFGALTTGNRLTPRAGLLLGWPVVLAIAAGLITDDLVNERLRAPVQTVASVIRTVRAYEGDLFALSLERGVNYNALKGVRDQIGEDYTLQLSEVIAYGDLAVVTAHFESGAWINCNLLAFNLSHCYDATPPYTRGLAAALTGADISDCKACTIRFTPEAEAWLASAARPAEQLQITYLAQAGGYVWMRAEWPARGQAVACLFRGTQPIYLERCQTELSAR
jgi:hypothetical protein